MPECQYASFTNSEIDWRTLQRNKWPPLQRNRGVLCSGINGVPCVGMVAYFGAEYPLGLDLFRLVQCKHPTDYVFTRM